MYAVPVSIANLTEERESTWNSGYNREYFFDQGVLYKTISKKFMEIIMFARCSATCKKRNIKPVGKMHIP